MRNRSSARNEAALESASSRFISLGDVRVHYRSEGRGPALVLLHGLMSCLRVWDGWVDELAPHYRVIRLDLPGFGASSPPAGQDYSLAYTLELLEELRARLDLDRFHLAGNDLGGFLAWLYAAQHPERVDKLILLDPLGYPNELPPFVRVSAWPMLSEVLGTLGAHLVLAHYLRAAYGDPAIADQPSVARQRELLERASNRRALRETCRQLREHERDHKLRRAMRRLRAETLLMWGERDLLLAPSGLEAWRRDLPTASVRLYAGAGHMPMEELPVLTARDAHGFLSGELAPRDDERSGEHAILPLPYARGA